MCASLPLDKSVYTGEASMYTVFMC